MRSKNPKYYTYSKKKKLFEVRKTIKGEFHSFGYYPSELEAQFIVEGLKKANWNPDNLEDEYKKFWISKNTEDPLKYIYRKKYGWSIDKRINNENVHFFSSVSLIECLMVRDLLIANDWDIRVIPCKETKTNEKYIFPATNSGGYFIQKSLNGHDEYFEYCRTLEQAIHERDLLIKYNWDMELVCENDDEILGGEMWLNNKLAKSNIIYKPPHGRIDYDGTIFPTKTK